MLTEALSALPIPAIDVCFANLTDVRCCFLAAGYSNTKYPVDTQTCTRSFVSRSLALFPGDIGTNIEVTTVDHRASELRETCLPGLPWVGQKYFVYSFRSIGG
jgi:hypothetical protein